MSVTQHTLYALQLCTLPFKTLKLVETGLISIDISKVIHPYCVPVPQQNQQKMSPQQIFLDINRHMDHLLVLL